MQINGYDIILSENVRMLLDNYDENVYAPRKDEIFRSLELSSFFDTKVVIIGQDPYPTKGDAMGLSFSVNDGVKNPKSLANIFKELYDDLGIKRDNGNLKDIASQGVLFLNMVLTVEIGKANSHSKLGWQATTENIVKQLSNRGDVIFVLLGNEAQKIETLISDSNIIIKTSHPSPLGVYRGFRGYRLFSKINEACKKLNYPIIKW